MWNFLLKFLKGYVYTSFRHFAIYAYMPDQAKLFLRSRSDDNVNIDIIFEDVGHIQMPIGAYGRFAIRLANGIRRPLRFPVDTDAYQLFEITMDGGIHYIQAKHVTIFKTNIPWDADQLNVLLAGRKVPVIFSTQKGKYL